MSESNKGTKKDVKEVERGFRHKETCFRKELKELSFSSFFQFQNHAVALVQLLTPKNGSFLLWQATLLTC